MERSGETPGGCSGTVWVVERLLSECEFSGVLFLREFEGEIGVFDLLQACCE